MTPTEILKQKLIDYFASVSRVGRVYGMRDFNDQIMMNTYAAEERAVLPLALQALVEDGVLRQKSPAEFELTAKGLDMMRPLRRTAATH